jgi:hypothetical protein
MMAATIALALQALDHWGSSDCAVHMIMSMYITARKKIPVVPPIHFTESH